MRRIQKYLSGLCAAALLLSLLKALLQLFHVGVGVTITLSLAEAYAVDDGSVVEGVRDDGVLIGKERAEETSVGVEAGSIQDGVFCLEVFCDGSLQLLVDVLSAADEAY